MLQKELLYDSGPDVFDTVMLTSESAGVGDHPSIGGMAYFGT